MHQTFYIDIDEEITSLIDRLRKSKTKENIFVIPKRALILQSVVNLKVLKKEADKLKKQIMIVTQDEQGRAIAEKVGIFAQNSLDSVESAEELKIEIQPKIKISEEENLEKKQFRKKVLENIGSENFYENSAGIDANKDFSKSEPAMEKKVLKITESARKTNEKIPVNRQEKKSRGKKMSDIFSSAKKSGTATASASTQDAECADSESGGEDYEKEFNSFKERELDEFYRFSDEDCSDKKEEKTPIIVQGKLKKIFIAFGVVSLIAIFIVGIFLFMPKAKIGVRLLSKTQEIDFEITGKEGELASGEFENGSIPMKIIELEKEKESVFQASGKNTISDQKARGMVTIYNEYNSSSQSLVATTRFAAPDGKIFRLVKGVVVPGMTIIGGQSKPGVIEVEVMADKAGEEYNIQPTNFSIPGFAGSLKFDKFHARSASPMLGGGSRGSEVFVVSQADIDRAKKEIETAIKNELQEEMKNKMSSNEILLEDMSEFVLVNSYVPEAGIIAENFNLKSKMKIRAMVFSEKTLKFVAEKKFSKQDDEKISQLKIEYGKATVDFEKKTVSAKVHGKALLEPKMDIDKLKEDLSGKNQEDLEEFIKNNPQKIKEMEIEFLPKFLPGKVPTDKNRIEIEVFSSEF